MKRTQLIAVLLVLAFASANAFGNTIIDLATGPILIPHEQTAAVGGSFIVSAGNPPGIIDFFLRVQPTGNGTSERGYNTNNGTPLDDQAGTRVLPLERVPIVNIGGTSYRRFLLDINQDQSNSLLSLNQIQIFQSNSDPTAFNLTEATAGTFAVMNSFTPAATQIFQMSNNTAGTNYEIKMDAALNFGGVGDMQLLVRDSDFNPFLTNVILFSQFGTPNGANATNGDFEAWGVVRTAAVPEPGSLLLLGAGLGTLAFIRKRILN